MKLAPGVDPHSLTDGIRKMQEAHQPLAEIEAQGTKLAYSLSPFSKMHTSDQGVKGQIILTVVVLNCLKIARENPVVSLRNE